MATSTTPIMDQTDRPVALVTGARRGLGRAIAYSLADAGYDLVISDIVEDDELHQTLKFLKSKGCEAKFLQHDLADIDGHAAFTEKVISIFGRIDCLVNNAGVQVPERIGILDVSTDHFDAVLNINLRGTFFLTQHVARAMAASNIQPGGHSRSIITITSSNASIASTDKAAYCLSKAALSMMTALFALELGQYGVGVFEIRPGLMITDMTAQVREKYSDYVENHILFKRWGLPDEIGRTVATLAKNCLPYSSGQIINVDGGMHIQRL